MSSVPAYGVVEFAFAREDGGTVVRAGPRAGDHIQSPTVQIRQRFANDYLSLNRGIPFHVYVQPIAPRSVLDGKSSRAVCFCGVSNFVIAVKGNCSAFNGIALGVHEDPAHMREVVWHRSLDLRVGCRSRGEEQGGDR